MNRSNMKDYDISNLLFCASGGIRRGGHSAHPEDVAIQRGGVHKHKTGRLCGPALVRGIRVRFAGVVGIVRKAGEKYVVIDWQYGPFETKRSFYRYTIKGAFPNVTPP